jgi:hypothetical protein
MTQTYTLIATLTAAAAFGWLLRRTIFKPDSVHVRLRLDRSAPGAHLMWDISNAGRSPITVTKLIVHTGSRLNGRTESITLGRPQVLHEHDHALLPTDVDWTLLSARSIAVADADGREHVVSRQQLAAIHEQLRPLIDRRAYRTSARDWLIVSTDMAFGVVILGLGFFMLMWVIYTG